MGLDESAAGGRWDGGCASREGDEEGKTNEVRLRKA